MVSEEGFKQKVGCYTMVINGVMSPVNSLKKWVTGIKNPYKVQFFTLLISGDRARLEGSLGGGSRGDGNSHF